MPEQRYKWRAIKRLGLNSGANSLTRAEYQWIDLQERIDERWTFCEACERELAPIRERDMGLAQAGAAGAALLHFPTASSYPARYCPDCGESLWPEDIRAEETAPLCPDCNWHGEPGDRFCRKCGMDLEEDLFAVIAAAVAAEGLGSAEVGERFFPNMEVIPESLHSALMEIAQNPHHAQMLQLKQRAAIDAMQGAVLSGETGARAIHESAYSEIRQMIAYQREVVEYERTGTN